MIATNTTDILTHRLKKLAQSGLSPADLAEDFQRLMLADRAAKLTQLEPSEDSTVALFARRRVHLNVI